LAEVLKQASGGQAQIGIREIPVCTTSLSPRQLEVTMHGGRLAAQLKGSCKESSTPPDQATLHRLVDWLPFLPSTDSSAGSRSNANNNAA
jgi:hypothetical protein